MFMIATIQRIVSGTPTHSGRACTPRTGNVKRCTQSPKPVGIAAARTWPPSFSHQTSPRKSSIAPTVVATAAPSSRPRVSEPSGRNASAGTKIPKKSAIPPSRGTARRLSAARAGLVDDAEQPGHPAYRRRQEHDDHHRDHGAVENLGVVAERRPHGYFVP